MAESVSIKIRFHNNDIVAIGPGKADLLDAIITHGSITAAGRSMGMSYKRSWDLVNAMNTNFKKPLVTTSRGGTHGGGARVTAFGQSILEHYRHIESKAKASIEKDVAAITDLINS
ncbi:winged helix-turn-helix domain-containing protein [Methylophaga sp.]|uniref:winged helix-turn-helix domain-containing protein n=1 Tax=Methylophaga sp. TaxID=2024840 RepID=UPI003F6A1677